MANFKTIDELEKYIATRSYITGYSFSADDRTAYQRLSGAPNQATHPNAYRWALHVAALSGTPLAFLGAVTTTAPSSSAAVVNDKIAAHKEKVDKTFTPAKAPAPAAAKSSGDDMDDMFADEEVNEDGETAEEAAATKARQERMALALKLKEEKDAKEGKVKKEKEKPVEKSLVVLEVKPWETDTDLKMVWEKIKEYKQEGLSWGETFELQPVAYGIMKLVMTCTIVDSLVLMDDVTDAIEALEEWVQSVQVASMNKIS